jgi:hypothetical protein
MQGCLCQSIVEPSVHMAPGFPSGILAATYQAQLSEQEIEDLVAYLLILR